VPLFYFALHLDVGDLNATRAALIQQYDFGWVVVDNPESRRLIGLCNQLEKIAERLDMAFVLNDEPTRPSDESLEARERMRVAAIESSGGPDYLLRLMIELPPPPEQNHHRHQRPNRLYRLPVRWHRVTDLMRENGLASVDPLREVETVLAKWARAVTSRISTVPKPP
jgi:hypothetical protein